MSCVPVDGAEACANCGTTGCDTNVKLKICTACRLVKYCSVDCQKAHRKPHRKACKQRAAELKDEQLYSQGHERPEEDFCPICTLPIELRVHDHSVINVCCMKRICDGCDFATQNRGMSDCAFCRAPCLDDDADALAMAEARVEKKDPIAMLWLGQKYFHGELGLQKDGLRAVEMWTEAAEHGSIQAIFGLGYSYRRGEGVDQNDEKAAELYKKAAMLGHVESRHSLGCYEGEKGEYDRAARHFFISAKMGYEDSVEAIKKMFMVGLATKEQYAQALKGYQDSLEGMKSHDRDQAKKVNLNAGRRRGNGESRERDEVSRFPLTTG